MRTIAKCISESSSSTIMEIISSNGKIKRIERRPKLNRNSGYLYEYHIDNSGEYTGERINTWAQVCNILMEFPNLQVSGSQYLDFFNAISIEGEISWGKYLIDRFCSELAEFSQEKITISKISEILTLLNDNNGTKLNRDINQHKPSMPGDSFYNSYCRVLAAIVLHNKNNIQDVIQQGREVLTEDTYAYLLSYIFEIIKDSKEALKAAIRADVNIAFEAKNEQERTLCVQVCPKEQLDTLQRNFGDYIPADECQRINEEFVTSCIKNALEGILKFSCVIDLEVKRDSGDVYEYAFLPGYSAKRDGIKRSYTDKKLDSLKPEQFDKLKEAIKKSQVFVGHKFKSWDNPILSKNGIEIADEQVWDTLEVEILIDGYQDGGRKNFALNVDNGHEAFNDVLKTQILFRQQLAKILCLSELFFVVKEYIPKQIANEIETFQQQSLSKSIEDVVVKSVYDDNQHGSCLYDMVPEKKICSSIIGKEGTDCQRLIIADDSYWPQIAKEISNVKFHYSDSIKFCNILDCEEIINQFTECNDVFHKYVYLRAKNALSRNERIRLCDIPRVVANYEYEKDHKISSELIGFLLPSPDNSRIHCANSQKAIKLLLSGDFKKIALIGAQYYSKDIELSSIEVYKELKTKLLSYNKVYDFTKIIRLPNELVGQYIPDASPLFTYWAYQTRPGDFEIKRQLESSVIEEYCSTKKYELIECETKNRPLDFVRIINNQNGNSYSLDDTEEEKRLKYWKSQLETILCVCIDCEYPVVIVDNIQEAEALHKFLSARFKVIFNRKEVLYKRLDQLREGKNTIGIAYLGEILSIPNQDLCTPFSFILNDTALLFFSTETAMKVSLCEFHKRINEHSSGSELILINPKPVELFSNYTFELAENVKPLTDDEVNKLSVYLAGVNPITEEDIKYEVKGLEELDDNGCPKKARNLGKVLAWIEENIIDKRHHKERELSEIQIKAIQKPILNESGVNRYLTIMPTGGGKSAIFQGPILYKTLKIEGYDKLNLVISPLQALMKDQVDKILCIPALFKSASTLCKSFKGINNEELMNCVKECEKYISEHEKSSSYYWVKQLVEKLDIIINNQLVKNDKTYAEKLEPVNYYLTRYNALKYKVAYINSSTTRNEKIKITDNIKNHVTTLLYIAPERLMIRSFFEEVILPASKEQGIDSVVFDEAHCITGWGMDFRPSYIFALRKMLNLQTIYSNVSIHLFTATLPEQCKQELLSEIDIKNGNIIPNIPEIDEQSRYKIKTPDDKAYYESLCPIRDHIAISARRIQEKDIEGEQNDDSIFEKKIEDVFSSITESRNIDIQLLLDGKSRIIVFTYSRANAEDGCKLLKEKLKKIPEDNVISKAKTLAEKVSFFHAGLKPWQKNNIIEEFRDGQILILFSTKAFGLGMDIPNIHHVIHLTPPSFIEDYLQEVGRAGRNKDDYENAFPLGQYKEREKIKAVCLYSHHDIKKNKDRINCISWPLVVKTYQYIINYIKTNECNRKLPYNRFYAIPIDLLERQIICSKDNVKKDDDLKELFQQCLGWLSKKKQDDIKSYGLECLEIGYSCPDSFDIDVKDLSTTGLNQKSNLYKLLTSLKETGINTGRTLIQANELLKDEKYDINCASDVEKIIDEGVAYGKFSKDFMYVSISVLSNKYINNFVESNYDFTDTQIDNPDYLASLDEKTEKIMEDANAVKISQINVIRQMIRISSENKGRNFDELLQSAFTNLRITEENDVKYLSKCINNDTWEFINEIVQYYPIDDIEKACYNLLTTAYLSKAKAISWKIITDVTKTHNDPNLAKIILLLLKELHLIRFGDTATDFLEVKIKNLDRKIRQTPEPGSDDALAEEELKKFYDAKEKKSGAMCGLIELMNSFNDVKTKSSENAISAAREKLRNYYNSRPVIDVKLIEQMDGSELAKQYIRIYSEENLNGSRQSIIQGEFEHLMAASNALAKKVGSVERNASDRYELDTDQIAIYNEHPTQNFNVRAGAGSGKTRLLSYWALKLIFDRHRTPEEILILTYNHSVRDELEERIIDYSNKVGRTVIPKVYTFHEFALKNVEDLRNTNDNFKGWEEALLCDIIKNQSGSKYHYNYILIDEFQDVTTTRLEIIKRLISSGGDVCHGANVFVVGDERQSIYGYVKKASVKEFLCSENLMNAIMNEVKDSLSNPIDVDLLKGKTLSTICDILVKKPDLSNAPLLSEIEKLLIFNEENGTVQVVSNKDILKLKDIMKYISIDPIDYYKQLPGSSKSYKLTNNYRSYQPIIDLASSWLEHKPDLEKENRMISQRKEKVTPEQCLVRIEGDWRDAFETTIIPRIEKLYTSFKDSNRDFKEDPLEVGILFRCNSELYIAYRWIKEWAAKYSDKYATPIIQGSDIYYNSTREFFFFGRLLKEDKGKEIAKISLIDNISIGDLFQKQRDIEKSEEEQNFFDENILMVAKSLAKSIIAKNKEITCAKLAAKFNKIAQREKDNLKVKIKVNNDSRIKIVLSSIHKVKGMEYDAVVVPTSQYPTDLSDDDLDTEESLMEERRLMYVAYTRAKSLLFYQEADREKCIRNGTEYIGQRNINYAKNGLGKVDVSFGATCDKVNQNLTRCHIGEPLVLKKEDGKWQLHLKKEDLLIGRLASTNKIVVHKDGQGIWQEIDQTKKYEGLYIKSVNIFRKENEQYNRIWAQGREYVYYVDYDGCITF